MIVVVGVLVIGVPFVLLAESFAMQILDLIKAYENKTLMIPQPNDEVAAWPVVGEQVYAAWKAAATNLQDFAEANLDRIEAVGRRVVAAATNAATGVLLFLASLIVAGIMMAWGQSGGAALRRIICRVAGPEKGADLHQLSIMTVRSVAAGVIGVAFIQALILGIGFIFAGVPAAGVLALIVMILGIMQLPALVVSLPVVAWIWVSGDASTISNIVWSIYLILGGAADNVLKPLLLGRGVDAPMPVILLGAIGGMLSAGIVGLFIGSVLLAVGYELFMEWVGDEEASAQTDADAPSVPAAE